MGIFNFGKKKVVEELVPCDCGGMCTPSDIAAKKEAERLAAAKQNSCCGGIDAESLKNATLKHVSGASVKVLGSGCKKCNDLEAATVEALKNLGMDTTIDHVKDFAEISSYGVMSTPALVVDGKVVSCGKVLKVAEAEELIKKARS